MASTFDSSRNYAQEIADAIRSGASASYVSELNAARDAKIAANQDYYNAKGISSKDDYAASAYAYSNLNTSKNTEKAASSSADTNEYLKDMYAQNTAADLASLKSAYDANAADLKADAEKIPATYTAAKNEAAAQNDLQAKNFNEYAAARGLNTGTSGQAVLANQSALLNNLSGINTAQANALSDNALEQTKLAAAYNNAISQAKASGNSALASALYSEYVRQMEAASAAETAAQEQANWQAQFDYQKQMDAQNYALSMMKTNSSATGSGGGSASAKVKSNMSLSAAKEYFKNGIFDESALKVMHDNGYSDEYLSTVYGYGSDSPSGSAMNPSNFEASAKSIAAQLAAGKQSAAEENVNRIWSYLSSDQQQQIQVLLSKFGLTTG